MAVFRVERTKDYTVMSNHHLKNKNLSLKAKGLLSQMLSLPEEWDYSLKGLAKINKESVDAVRTAVLELESAGYVLREQTRAAQGTFSQIEYVIYEIPQLDSPILENPITDNPITEKPMSENPIQLNTNQENKKESNTEYINYSSNPIPSYNPSLEEETVDKSDSGRERKGQRINNYDLWERQIKTNVDYESLMVNYPYEHQLIDEIISIMVETVMSNRAMIRIAGDDYPFSVVKEKFLQIRYDHMQFIIEGFNEGARNTEIKNIKQYIKAVIFNAPTTIDSYYTAKVRYDMPWLGKNHDER